MAGLYFFIISPGMWILDAKRRDCGFLNTPVLKMSINISRAISFSPQTGIVQCTLGKSRTIFWLRRGRVR